MRQLFTFALLFFSLHTFTFAQLQKKVLDHTTYDIWNTLHETKISNDGAWAAYVIKPGKGDPSLHLYATKGSSVQQFPRSLQSSFTWDSDYLIFKIKAPYDTVINMRRRKMEEHELPKDTLALYDLDKQSLIKIPNVKDYKLPAEWSGNVAYQLAPVKFEKDSTIADSLQAEPKPNDDKNGYTLILRSLTTAHQDTFRYVVDYKFAKHGHQLVFHTSGDSIFKAGVYVFDCQIQELKALHQREGKYKSLAIDEKGDQVAFLASFDTTNHPISYYDLWYWHVSRQKAGLVADTNHISMPEGWYVNQHDSIEFSQNGKRLYFSISPVPELEDTTLLDEEIVGVEVWSYMDQRLHTQQNIELEKDKKKGYRCWYNPENEKLIQLSSQMMPRVMLSDEGNGTNAIALSNEKYQKFVSWEGFPLRNDVYRMDVQTGKKELAIENLRSHSFNLSPKGNFIYWIDVTDSSWYTYSFQNGIKTSITNNIPASMTSEIHDSPTPPQPYGIAGWTQNDEYLLVYDRYDIWKVDPKGKQQPINLTNGRGDRKVYRYLKLDKRKKFIDDNSPLLLRSYDEVSRSEGYAKLNVKNGKLTNLLEIPYKVSKPVKALESNELIYSMQNFNTFPDLHLANLDFSKTERISNANPQKEEYSWGTGEIISWTSLDGKVLEGMLFKPDNFDPKKKYPMIVNFYEKSSHTLHRHRFPKPERSTINYALYVSNGYIIFNPDVHYRIGYPGESCFNSVIPGITKLVNQGFIDEDRIGLQGHSWGGYQAAYLVTKTDIFAAAEAGAPVPNMISAYGGIRWWTGLSRMFQYEHTQSRIGGTLWEYPMRFIENSPIFFLDKINTPLLLMHNDADGHVPWYQGIELFVGLRRLGKPSWMLNYPGEPHWPLKRQNQVDFNIRMMQFFDHYLKDAPAPKWMEKGVPAVDKGINLGYELIEEKE